MANDSYTNPTSLGRLPDGWKVQTIEALCQTVTSGGTPLRSNREFYKNGTIKWVKTGELNDWYIDDTEEKITIDAVKNSSAKVLPANTILMAMYGDGKTITSLGILRNEAATNQACCALIANPNICHYLYLFYALKYHRSDFIQLATGGAQRNLSGTLIRNFALKVPALIEQEAIAHFLSTLDDRIELNRQMNETLESIAQALFKSWFVDFDPVKANAEGRKPEGMDDSIAALFPSDFTDSTLGYIPLGWKVTPLADICENIFSGGTPSTQIANYWNGNVPWLSSGETRNRFIIHTEKTITEEGVANSSTRLVRCGCTVIAGAGQGHTRGQTSLLMLDSYINQSVVALKANPKISSDFFLFFDLTRRYEEFRQLSDSHSSRGSLTTKLLSGVKVVLPPAEVIQKFDDAARPVVAKIIANLHHSRTLANLRDIMLLHLISGKLRVGEISETVEALAL